MTNIMTNIMSNIMTNIMTIMTPWPRILWRHFLVGPCEIRSDCPWQDWFWHALLCRVSTQRGSGGGGRPCRDDGWWCPEMPLRCPEMSWGYDLLGPHILHDAVHPGALWACPQGAARWSGFCVAEIEKWRLPPFDWGFPHNQTQNWWEPCTSGEHPIFGWLVMTHSYMV